MKKFMYKEYILIIFTLTIYNNLKLQWLETWLKNYDKKKLNVSYNIKIMWSEGCQPYLFFF